VGLFVLWAYLWLRLAFAGPMTFAEHRLRIFDSWDLTRGQVLRVIGLLLLLCIFIFAVAIVAGMVRNIVLFGALGDIWHDLFTGSPQARIAAVIAAAGPALIGFMIVQAFADTLLRVISAAPFARAYSELVGDHS
jgi:hypothetical protein